MNVRELIAELQKLDPEALVITCDAESVNPFPLEAGITYDWIEKDNDGMSWSQDGAPGATRVVLIC
jgi:hypothetical protein